LAGDLDHFDRDDYLVPASEEALRPGQGSYSALDRFLHSLAFATWAPQFTAADVEKVIFGARFRDIPVERPIFITSLPRAGTTLLLEIFSRAPTLVSHCYRDMPFVLAPMLWDAFSRRFHRQSELTERAHGDGMQIDYDSPEAFEEVVWRAFWPEKFKSALIPLWVATDEREGFSDFFYDHIRKVIAVRSNRGPAVPGYVSKNNANIARLGFLKRMFPDCEIVVPFRNPVAQSRSLLRLHNRFTEIHRRDPFSKRYMRDIGHFEFGELHRPINFAGVEAMRSRFSPHSLAYWLGYWAEAFEQILDEQDHIILLSYDRMCQQGASSLVSLENRCHLSAGSLTLAARDILRAPGHYESECDELETSLLDRVELIHERLLERSIV
jgi:hypothetical protein